MAESKTVKLQTLGQYKEKVQAELLQLGDQSTLSGIACPFCGTELDWAERSLFTTHPPMRRLVCSDCGLTEVVPVSN